MAKSRRGIRSDIFNPLCISPNLGGEELQMRFCLRARFRIRFRVRFRVHFRARFRVRFCARFRAYSNARSMSRREVNVKMRVQSEFPSPRLGRVRVGLT